MRIFLILCSLFLCGCFVNRTYTFKYSAVYVVHPVSHKSKIQFEEIVESTYKIKVYKDSVKINEVLYDVYSRREIARGVEEIDLGGEKKLILLNTNIYKVALLYKNKHQYYRLTQQIDDI